jgi:hypothetical protein
MVRVSTLRVALDPEQPEAMVEKLFEPVGR